MIYVPPPIEQWNFTATIATAQAGTAAVNTFNSHLINLPKLKVSSWYGFFNIFEFLKK